MTRRELLDTKEKIRKKYWSKDLYTQWSDSMDAFVHSRDGQKWLPDFDDPSSWEYYIEPKKKKTVKLVEYICRPSSPGNYSFLWFEEGMKPSGPYEYLSTGQTREIEVDDE